jgi:hypothetical protein
MAIPRSKLVNPAITPWYHCISKVVRDMFLLDSQLDQRKQWIESRLEELNGIFSIDVAGFSVMGNHLHLLVHLDPGAAKNWTKTEVLQRWAQLHPPRGADRQPLKCIKEWIKEKMSDRVFIKECRKRLSDLGWYMKSLKEPLARLINAQENCSGPVWTPRYKSIAVLGEDALLAICVYIDLNPLAAGKVKLPEEARFTSLWVRLAYCRQMGRLSDLQAARAGSVVSAEQLRGLEDGLWLCPMEDRRAQGGSRVGMLEGFSLASYLLLVDETSRILREGKASVNPQAAALLDRLGTSVETWESTMKKMTSRSLPRGVAFSFHREKLQQAAQKRGCHHLANLNGCPA